MALILLALAAVLFGGAAGACYFVFVIDRTRAKPTYRWAWFALGLSTGAAATVLWIFGLALTQFE